MFISHLLIIQIQLKRRLFAGHFEKLIFHLHILDARA